MPIRGGMTPDFWNGQCDFNCHLDYLHFLWPPSSWQPSPSATFFTNFQICSALLQIVHTGSKIVNLEAVLAPTMLKVASDACSLDKLLTVTILLCYFHHDRLAICLQLPRTSSQPPYTLLTLTLFRLKSISVHPQVHHQLYWRLHDPTISHLF